MNDIIKISEVPEYIVQEMQRHNVWSSECPVDVKDFSYIQIQHYNFEGKIQEGELIAHSKIADKIARIFTALFNLKFSIEKMRLIHHYSGNDFDSMADNNSSCFNYRKMLGFETNHLSKHAYGLAIDINPIHNPYIVWDNDTYETAIYPKTGVAFLNRSNVRDGMVEPIVHLFKQEGFEWGGDWNTPIDYHHFQYPPRLLGY